MAKRWIVKGLQLTPDNLIYFNALPNITGSANTLLYTTASINQSILNDIQSCNGRVMVLNTISYIDNAAHPAVMGWPTTSIPVPYNATLGMARSQMNQLRRVQKRHQSKNRRKKKENGWGGNLNRGLPPQSSSVYQKMCAGCYSVHVFIVAHRNLICKMFLYRYLVERGNVYVDLLQIHHQERSSYLSEEQAILPFLGRRWKSSRWKYDW